jgi:four helix bundle protein
MSKHGRFKARRFEARRFKARRFTTRSFTTPRFVGTGVAALCIMGARTYRELLVYQGCSELRRDVQALLELPRARMDRKFCEQLRNAVRSPPRNIAEGLGRYNPGECVQFMDVAIASLDETDNHLRDGVESGYFPPDAEP